MSTDLRGPEPAARAATPARAARRAMFHSQDGVVLCMTLKAMDELGVLAPSLAADRSLADLYPGLTSAGFGALRVAVRSLAGAGWLADAPTLDPSTTVLRWTDTGRLAARHQRLYVALGDFLAGFASTSEDAWSVPWHPGQIDRFLEFVERASDRWRLGDELPAPASPVVRAQLDGSLAVPMMLWLHECGRLGDDGAELRSEPVEEGMRRLLETFGWLDEGGGEWTETGRYARRLALNFGGVATYLPLLARLPELYRGELTVSSTVGGDAGEWHVHRQLNVRISAAAHRSYFADADAIILELFDREPVEHQPRFIADMGCGEGSWLAHLYGSIREQTRRGEVLEAYPLTMVGIDLSTTALEQARRNLERAGVPAVLLQGDVTDPGQLGTTLSEHGLKIEDGLHIRAFLDHERTYLGSEEPTDVPGWSSGAYLDARGEPLSGEAIERDLVTHLRRWASNVDKHGMVVLEAHCVAPQVSSRHPGELHGVALDAHQSYSKQYPVDHQAFIRCCQEAGLRRLGYCERRYPPRRPFVAVSLNRLLAAGAESPLPAVDGAVARRDTWRPDPGVDLEDGRALHTMLFEGGDISHPAMWCSPPTGYVVAGALEVIEARLDNAQAGDVIRILDYGAGTGTATIELLKACQERGVDERLARRDASLELHLVDLPTSWYAQAYALLGECAWTRFHSLRSAEGGFRSLLDVTGGELIDAVMANMVFHLIPSRALERVADQLASVLVRGGTLSWSAPDLGPPAPCSVLLHDPNRALRERWLELLGGVGPDGDGRTTPVPYAERAAILARQSLDAEALRAAADRADRRILPRPLVTDVTGALGSRFSGEVEFQTYEMLGEEIVRGLLVPSNQLEYLPEIQDRELREEVIRELMRVAVLPAMQASDAGTALGLNFHWTLGRLSNRT